MNAYEILLFYLSFLFREAHIIKKKNLFIV